MPYQLVYLRQLRKLCKEHFVSYLRMEEWESVHKQILDMLGKQFAGYCPIANTCVDPKLPMVKGRIAWTLLRKKLGFRTMMQVIPIDATLVKGSHGRPPATSTQSPSGR